MIDEANESAVDRRAREAAREALEKHKTLQELLRLSRADPEIPFAPAQMRTEMTVEPRRVRFAFPIAGFGLRDVALMVAAAGGVPGLMALLRWSGYAENLREDRWLTGAVALAVALGFRAWVLATRRIAVTVSRERLEWVREGPLGRRCETFDRADIERVILPSPPTDQARAASGAMLRFPIRPLRERPGVRVEAESGSVEFGRNLSYVELRWIHDVAGRLLGLKNGA